MIHKILLYEIGIFFLGGTTSHRNGLDDHFSQNLKSYINNCTVYLYLFLFVNLLQTVHSSVHAAWILLLKYGNSIYVIQ